MNFWVHLAIAAVLTGYFVFRYVKDRQIYQLLFVFWVPSTLLSYLPVTDPEASRIFRMLLAIFQVIMFVLVLVFMFLPRKRTTEEDSAEKETANAGSAAVAEEETCAAETAETPSEAPLSAPAGSTGAPAPEKEESR